MINDLTINEISSLIETFKQKHPFFKACQQKKDLFFEELRLFLVQYSEQLDISVDDAILFFLSECLPSPMVKAKLLPNSITNDVSFVNATPIKKPVIEINDAKPVIDDIDTINAVNCCVLS
ncbi:MAG: hypothetical protein VX835_02765 [Pseudomonadota bacterium]|nr:hypothetical protein [Pseudomonadota bacterium]